MRILALSVGMTLSGTACSRCGTTMHDAPPAPALESPGSMSAGPRATDTEPAIRADLVQLSEPVDEYWAKVTDASAYRVEIHRDNPGMKIVDFKPEKRVDLAFMRVHDSYVTFESAWPDCFFRGCEWEHSSYLFDTRAQKVQDEVSGRVLPHHLPGGSIRVQGGKWFLARRAVDEQGREIEVVDVRDIGQRKTLWSTLPRFQSTNQKSVLVTEQRIFLCETDQVLGVYDHEGALQGSYGTKDCADLRLSGGVPVVDGAFLSSADWEGAGRQVRVSGKITAGEGLGHDSPAGWVEDFPVFSGWVLVGRDVVRAKPNGTFSATTRVNGSVIVRALPAVGPDVPHAEHFVLGPAETQASDLDLEIYFDSH